MCAHAFPSPCRLGVVCVSEEQGLTPKFLRHNSIAPVLQVFVTVPYLY